MKKIYGVLGMVVASLFVMNLGSILGLTKGTIYYIERILYWSGNVALVIAIVSSAGAGASITTLIYSYLKKKGIKWTAMW